MLCIASFFCSAARMRYITNVILLSKFVIENHVASFLDEAAERLVSHEFLVANSGLCGLKVVEK